MACGDHLLDLAFIVKVAADLGLLCFAPVANSGWGPENRGHLREDVTVNGNMKAWTHQRSPEIEEDEMKEVKGEVMEMQSAEVEMEAGVSDVEKAAGKTKSVSFTEGLRNFCSLLLGPVFVQAFVLTFLGEWGDRSQIATIVLGAAHVRFSLPPLVLLPTQ